MQDPDIQTDVEGKYGVSMDNMIEPSLGPSQTEEDNQSRDNLPEDKQTDEEDIAIDHDHRDQIPNI